MTKLSFLPSLQKTRHPAAGGNITYRLTVIWHSAHCLENQFNPQITIQMLWPLVKIGHTRNFRLNSQANVQNND
jgi:hypothetical protein